MPTGVYVRKTKPLKERFWAKVDKRGPDECWLWKKVSSPGYGKIMLEDQTLALAHRLSFFWAYGYWPPEDARHTCHNRACVNPRHLLEGTRAQNMQDMVDAGRSLVGERQPNHKLTWAKVAQARREHAAGASARSLAIENGVSERTMRQALAGETWKIESGER